VSWIFWAFAAYALMGVFSGVALGPKWLGSDGIGIPYGAFIATGLSLLVAGVVILLSLLKRGQLDGVSRYCALISWGAIVSSALWGGVGFRGRWPESDVIYAAHNGAMLLAMLLGALVAVVTLRIALASHLLVFRAPAVLLVASIASILLWSAVDVIFPAHGTLFVAAWTLSTVSIVVATMRLSYLTPHRERPSSCQTLPTSS